MDLKFSKIQSYKGREVDITKPVEVYRCLNRKGKIFSIRQDGKVVGHSTHLTLANCKFVVNEAGRKRCRATGERNVHAFIKGHIAPKGILGTGATLSNSTLPAIINYNPHEDLRFKNVSCKKAKTRKVYVKEALGVIINQDGVSASYVN